MFPGRALVTSAVLFAATGCALASRVAITDRDRIGTVHTVAGVTQQEIGTTVVASHAGAAFGLLGAIIDSSVDSSRAKGAEAAIVPLRNALLGYEPTTTLGASLTRELAPLTWLKGNAVELRPLAAPMGSGEMLEIARKGETDFTLLVSVSYTLSADGKLILLSGNVALLPRGEPAVDPKPAATTQVPGAISTATTKIPGAVYQNNIITTMRLTELTNGLPAHAIALWAENGGERARAAIDRGLAELARMIAFDLQQSAPLGGIYEPPAGAQPMVLLRANGSGVQGYALQDQSDGSWTRARARTGELFSVMN